AGVVASGALAGKDFEELVAQLVDLGRAKSGARADEVEEVLERVGRADRLKEAELMEPRVLRDRWIKRELPKHLAEPGVRDLLDYCGRGDASEASLQDSELRRRSLDDRSASRHERVVGIADLPNQRGSEACWRRGPPLVGECAVEVLVVLAEPRALPEERLLIMAIEEVQVVTRAHGHKGRVDGLIED